MDWKSVLRGTLWWISALGIVVSGAFAGFAPGNPLSNALWIVFAVCAVVFFFAERSVRKKQNSPKPPARL